MFRPSRDLRGPSVGQGPIHALSDLQTASGHTKWDGMGWHGGQNFVVLATGGMGEDHNWMDDLDVGIPVVQRSRLLNK